MGERGVDRAFQEVLQGGNKRVPSNACMLGWARFWGSCKSQTMTSLWLDTAKLHFLLKVCCRSQGLSRAGVLHMVTQWLQLPWSYGSAVIMAEDRGHRAPTAILPSFGQAGTLARSHVPEVGPVACVTARRLGSCLPWAWKVRIVCSWALLLSAVGSLEVCRDTGIAFTFSGWTVSLW